MVVRVDPEMIRVETQRKEHEREGDQEEPCQMPQGVSLRDLRVLIDNLNLNLNLNSV